MTGLVADIQRASFHDGCGIRTTVFMKGCPLNCAWCHNPECISFEREVLFYPEKCIGCKRCDEGCYSGARVECGVEYTPEALVSELLFDRVYFKNGGGVTFSGGEPLLQAEFIFECVRLLKKEGISCFVESSLCVYHEVLREFDTVMADLKCFDDDRHREYTGVGNEKIKDNIKKVNALGVPMVIRTPVIAGLVQDIDKISELARSLENVKQYELLPYHALGVEKARALGREQMEFSAPTTHEMKELQKYAFIR